MRANHFGRCECIVKPMFARVASAGQRAARQDRDLESVRWTSSPPDTAASSTIHAPPPWWKHLTAADADGGIRHRVSAAPRRSVPAWCVTVSYRTASRGVLVRRTYDRADMAWMGAPGYR